MDDFNSYQDPFLSDDEEEVGADDDTGDTPKEPVLDDDDTETAEE